jgi:hypothetical protein
MTPGPSQAREDFICHATGSANAATTDSDGSARDMGPWQNNVHLNVTFGGAKQSAVTGKPARDFKLSFLSLGQWGGPGMSGKEVNITGAGESRKARVRYHLYPAQHASSPPPPLTHTTIDCTLAHTILRLGRATVTSPSLRIILECIMVTCWL